MIRICVFLCVLSALCGDDAAPSAVPAKREGVLRVVCFGDSITGDRPTRRFTYQGDYLKFADLLQLLLEARLGPGKAEVINSGWGGDRTTPKRNEGWPGAVGRLDADLIGLEPEIAVILIGGNDNPKDEAAAATTRANLETIYTRTRDAGIQVLALLYHEAMASPEHEAKAWVHLDRKSRPLITAAAEAAGVELLDMAPPMAAAADTYGREQLTNDQDGVHLKPRGELVYALAIYRKLDELGWLPPAPEKPE